MDVSRLHEPAWFDDEIEKWDKQPEKEDTLPRAIALLKERLNGKEILDSKVRQAERAILQELERMTAECRAWEMVAREYKAAADALRNERFWHSGR
jgi:hypothetical protein